MNSALCTAGARPSSAPHASALAPPAVPAALRRPSHSVPSTIVNSTKWWSTCPAPCRYCVSGETAKHASATARKAGLSPSADVTPSSRPAFTNTQNTGSSASSGPGLASGSTAVTTRRSHAAARSYPHGTGTQLPIGACTSGSNW